VALLLGGGGVLLAQALPSLGSLVWGTPQAALVALWPVLARLLGWVVACWLAVGALDRLYQGWAWRRGLRMTRAQVEAERRQEGAASATRRRRGAWRWGDGPLSAVHQASAVIAAPGAAVALAWAPGARRSPVVLARARGASASRLLGAARGRGVPVAHDAELALGLAALPAGAPVPPALFEPLAACFHSLGLGAQTP
jgi:flagellar biosynthesis protein FlhB